jgi:Transposase IS66 family
VLREKVQGRAAQRNGARLSIRGNLRALVIYLRFTQGIAFGRLARLLSDILGLEISEGALVNMLDAARDAFARQTSYIRARPKSGTILQSDETGLRVGKRNWWLWVSSSSRRAAKRWSRGSSARFGPISGSRTVTAARWAGRNGKPSLSRSSHS